MQNFTSKISKKRMHTARPWLLSRIPLAPSKQLGFGRPMCVNKSLLSDLQLSNSSIFMLRFSCFTIITRREYLLGSLYNVDRIYSKYYSKHLP
jgi:hypothetical protein